MKCYCFETESNFLYRVENAAEKALKNLQSDPYWTRDGYDSFTKTYPMESGHNDAWYSDPSYRHTIADNFARLGASWLAGVFDWQSVLSALAKTLNENKIEWYIIGSVSAAVLGAEIKPHDIDIIVHTRDFYKVKGLFTTCTVEPFVDNKGAWLVRYFGKLCVDGASVDVAADDKMNLENHPYARALWNGFDVYIEPLQARYATEIARHRTDRARAIEKIL